MDEQDIEKEEQELSIEEQLALQKEHYLRIIAEYDNQLKRAKIDAQHLMNSVVERITLDIASVVADLTVAYEIANDEAKSGLEMILRNLKNALKKYGVEEISPAIGTDFDANLHNAIATEEAAEQGKIVKLVKLGYKLNGKVIDPALVVVSK